MSGREDLAARGDWLFDGGGEPSAEEREVLDAVRAARWEGDVEALMRRVEGASGADALAGEPPAAPVYEGALAGEPPVAPRALRRIGAAVLAAAMVLVAVNVWAFVVRGGGRSESAWTRATGGAWAVGEWVETAGGETVEVASDIGRVTVGPGSRVRLVRAAEQEHRLELAEGSIDAFIYAPPRLFFVDTPGATAVDMGCAYRLDVASDGSGVLRVTGGWVELQAAPLASRVPAGSVCRLGPGGTPGLPIFEDAPAELGAAVERLDAGDDSAIGAAIAAARPRDGLTLWHLGLRLDGDQHAEVLERLAALVPPPPGVLERAYRADAAALEEWWSAVRRAW